MHSLLLTPDEIEYLTRKKKQEGKDEDAINEYIQEVEKFIEQNGQEDN